jgi:hypothetical protein
LLKKIALETNEHDALAVANGFPPRWYQQRGLTSTG